ncbi:acyltransferase domain-containing protein [Rhodobacteraceae bacterium NNCM2]|nr:acyltransferase domain-containing protein [Coraliihabitans acroporae]
MSHTSAPSRPSAEIVVSGYSCRLPGAPDAAAFWALLEAGGVAIREIPDDRWDTKRFYRPGGGLPGTTHANKAGLIDGIWDFDPGFFGISPREAAQMDPQQRLLLEVVWEAMEHGKLLPGDVAGPRTGVFVGASACDHSISAMEDPLAIGANFMTGNTMSILSNRLSHQFDMRGPSYTVDTACSSSLYALHQAVGALDRGEVDTAIVAGVNLILSPFPLIGFSQASMLSPDGLCKAFDASANGYVRGEGCVAFVLRRGDRMAAHEPRRSQVMATAIASAGRTVGISMPSEEAQRMLLAVIYHEDGIDPADLAFVEAHGTGTPVGDPIEAAALGKVLGRRRGAPLPIGSAKTNVGHLEACSGLVGMLKAQLALERRRLPRSLHFETPNPQIDFDGLNLRVAGRGADWSEMEHPALAGINSFGFGGANAHAVLREIPAPVSDTPATIGAAPPLILTAASRSSLAKTAVRWREALGRVSAAQAGEMIADAAHFRHRHAHRAVLAGAGEALDRQLAALAEHQDDPGCLVGEAADRGGKTAFVFCGNGAQWAGMGLDLYRSDRDFANGYDQASDAFRSVSGTSLVDLLQDDGLSERIDDGLVAQPLLFAIQVGLVTALTSRGVRPDFVTGHSVGKVAATWAAGCVTLEDASRLIYARAKAMSPLRGTGGMAAVLAGAAEARKAASGTRIWLLVQEGAPSKSYPEQALIWGVGRVLANEYPDLDIRLLDIVAHPDPTRIADALCNTSEEREVIIADAGTFARRVAQDPSPSTPTVLSVGEATRRLAVIRPGKFESLSWEITSRRAPAPDEVEIEVAATGLNFRDMMWAQGLLPSEALEVGFTGATLGMECAGTVARSGEASGFEPGDRVVAFAPRAFARHVTIVSATVAKLPDHLDFTSAASLPTIFLTAHYALVGLARVRRGETVLVHGGAGGVGHAAIQIARATGARVFATAGTAEKRDWLLHSGVERVFDSRGLRFVEEARDAAGHDGIDIVLNSLAGDAMENSLSLLAPFGRFVELGKLDFYRNSRIGLRAMRRNISYFAVDVDQLVASRPDVARRTFDSVMSGFAEGSFTPPPIHAFEAADVSEAFRLMQKSGHIGKIVIAPPEVAEETRRRPSPPLGQGGWVIAGGLGGLGLSAAEWLAGHGVRSIWLCNRSGRPSPEDTERVEELRRQCDVSIIVADVTEPAWRERSPGSSAAG